jgi:hypothetical protein
MSIWSACYAWVYAEKPEDLVGLDQHFLMKGAYRLPNRTICKLGTEGADSSYYLENLRRMFGVIEEQHDRYGRMMSNDCRIHIWSGSKIGSALSGKRITESFPKAIVYSVAFCDVDPGPRRAEIHYGNESVKLDVKRHAFLAENLPQSELDIYDWGVKAVIFDPVSATFATTKQLFDRIQAFERSL